MLQVVNVTNQKTDHEVQFEGCDLDEGLDEALKLTIANDNVENASNFPNCQVNTLADVNPSSHYLTPIMGDYSY